MHDKAARNQIAELQMQVQALGALTAILTAAICRIGGPSIEAEIADEISDLDKLYVHERTDDVKR